MTERLNEGAVRSGSFPLETERLLIRPFTLADLEDFHKIFGDARVMQYIPSGTSADLEASRVRLARIMDQFERTGLSLWAVVEKTSQRVIGDCGLFIVEGKGPDVELAYHFAFSAWGNGFASEAAAACVRYGFQSAGLLRIVALVLPENVASVRVIEKAGLIYQGPGRHYNVHLQIYAAEAAAWHPSIHRGRIQE